MTVHKSYVNLPEVNLAQEFPSLSEYLKEVWLNIPSIYITRAVCVLALGSSLTAGALMPVVIRYLMG